MLVGLITLASHMLLLLLLLRLLALWLCARHHPAQQWAFSEHIHCHQQPRSSVRPSMGAQHVIQQIVLVGLLIGGYVQGII